MIDECEHGIENPLLCCSVCRRRFKKARLRTLDHLPPGWHVMEAQFDSRCPGCLGHIGAGENIFRIEEGEQFICESCALEELP